MALSILSTLLATSDFKLSSSFNVNPSDIADRYSSAFYDRTVLAPKGVKQIGAFSFDYKGGESVTMDNDVTDHWLEDNTAVQDHIGVRPNIITLKGFVSELSITSDVFAKISTALNAVQTALVRVNSYTGAYTPGAIVSLQKSITQAQNIAVQIEQAAARFAQIAAFLTGGPDMNKQQIAYFQLSSLRIARVVFTVLTPFQSFDNMVITNLKAIQSEKTKNMSDFSVTLKQLNFSDDSSTALYYANYTGRARYSKQKRAKNGSTAGAKLAAGAKAAFTGSFAPLL